MNSDPKHILAISYAKRALDPGSREYKRMQSYAAELGSYHMIVFTRASESFPAEQHVGGLHLYATNARTKVGMLWQAYRIGRTILQTSTSKNFLVSSQDPFETSVVGRALARHKYATHHIQIHGDVFNPVSYRSSLLQRLRVIYGRYVVRRTTTIRVVSERIKRSLLVLGVDASAVSVIPIQADLQSLLELGDSKKHTPGSVRMLYVGRLAPEKQIHILVQACRILCDQSFPFSLQIVGSGPEEERLKHMVHQVGLSEYIEFIAWTNDISEVMAAADVFCLTSAHEGWGMVLLEAAAAGLAIVSTDVGCVGECLKNEKDLLVVSNASTLAAAIVRLHDVSLRTTLSQSAYEVATGLTEKHADYTKRWVSAQGS